MPDTLTKEEEIGEPQAQGEDDRAGERARANSFRFLFLPKSTRVIPSTKAHHSNKCTSNHPYSKTPDQ